MGKINLLIQTTNKKLFSNKKTYDIILGQKIKSAFEKLKRQKLRNKLKRKLKKKKFKQNARKKRARKNFIKKTSKKKKS